MRLVWQQDEKSRRRASSAHAHAVLAARWCGYVNASWPTMTEPVGACHTDWLFIIARAENRAMVELVPIPLVLP